MCSWCYGFAPILSSIADRLVPGVELRLVMGGLAPDSDEPLPATAARLAEMGVAVLVFPTVANRPADGDFVSALEDAAARIGAR